MTTKIHGNRIELLTPVDPASVPTPADGRVLFSNVNDGDKIYSKDQSGSTHDLEGAGGGTDELAKVSANDTTPGYLLSKIVPGGSVFTEEINDGGNETLRLNSEIGIPIITSNTVSQTHTLTTFQNHLTLNIPAVVNGGERWLVKWFYTWNHNSQASDFEGQVQASINGGGFTSLINPGDANAALRVHKQEPKDSAGAGGSGSTQRHTNSGFEFIDIPPGAITPVEINFRTDNGADSSTVFHSVLMAMRMFRL